MTQRDETGGRGRVIEYLAVLALVCMVWVPGISGDEVRKREEEIAKYRELADSVTGGWRLGRQYYANYDEVFLTAERLQEMKKDYLLYLKELYRLQPEDAALCNEYAACLAYNGKAGEAIRILEPFSQQKDLPPELRADILMNLAEAEASRNDFKTAMRYAGEVASLNLDVNRRNDPWTDNLQLAAELAVFIDEGWDLDALKLPVYTGAKAFPTPQDADYTEDFVPLKNVKLLLGGDIKGDDARVRLLKVKFERFGIEFDDNAPFAISINENRLAAPERSEGYTLAVSRNEAILQGSDMLGTTWAVVSLIQLVDQEKNALRICKIKDWPDIPQRGYGYPSDYRYTLESALFSKIGVVSDQVNRLTKLLERIPPFRKHLLSEMFKAHRDFGISYFWGDRSLIDGMPLTSDNVRRMHQDYWMSIAEAGASGIIGCQEDQGCLIPMHPADLRNSGGGHKLYGKYFTGLFREVRKKYPEFKCLMWLPIDYGPDRPLAVLTCETAMNCSRETYMESLKTDLDPDIVMMFMGNRRGAYTREKFENDWAESLHGHKLHLSSVRPLSPYGYASLSDEIPFGKNYYQGIGDDIDGISIYLAAPLNAVQYAKFSDSVWNMEAYDMCDSAKRACEIYLGKGLYEAMKPAAEAFAELNTYYNPHACKLTPLALSRIDRLEECVRIAEEAEKKAKTLNPQTVIAYDNGYLWAARYVLGLARKAAPDHFRTTYASKIEESKVLARKEAGLDEKAGDIFKSSVDFIGGTLGNTRERAKEPIVTYFRGADTPLSYIEIPFSTVMTGSHELILSGMQDRDRLRPVTWSVLLNGKKVYEGETGLPDWPGPDGGTVRSTVKIDLPAEQMATNNVVRLKCTYVGGTVHFSPWIGVNYAIVRKKD